MPHIEISVNVPENSQAAEALEKDLYENLTKAHDKPIDWFMVRHSVLHSSLLRDACYHTVFFFVLLFFFCNYKKKRAFIFALWS
jgi:hypothetical protein